jgi:predicted nucleotidyltransferase
MKTDGAIKKFLGEIVKWASAQDDILAVALVGSRARGEAHEESDTDLVLLVEDPEKYLLRLEWLERFGGVKNHQLENYGMLTSLRVWYSDGREVEYGITTPRWAAEPLDEGTRRVIRDGMLVLFERGTILSRIALHRFRPPSE